MPSILLVEDDRSIAVVISTALEAEGLKVRSCTSIAERDQLLSEQTFPILITDVMLTDGDGLDGLENLLELHPEMLVIVLSAQNTLDTAVRASNAGAFEYFPKPFDLDELTKTIVRAMSMRGGSDQQVAAAKREPETAGLPLVGRSMSMQRVYRMITRVLRNDLSVLILGESGTGKELVAEAIHTLGHRQTGPFVAVNMAAIPADLIESELFGHERGAFTGAIAQNIGKFEQAQGGTLFLDEIGDMPMQAQTRLLRALQSGKISRVGGRQEIELDVRIVTATNKDIPALIKEGLFREDLYYRINVVPIELPPLRDRSDDIEALVQHFLSQAVEEGLPRRQISKQAVALLEQQPWRGNIRELRNFILRLAVVSREDIIDLELVRETLGQSAATNTGNISKGDLMGMAIRALLDSDKPQPGKIYDLALAALERPLLSEVLQRNSGNQIKTASALGINRNTLRKKLTDYQILPIAAK